MPVRRPGQSVITAFDLVTAKISQRERHLTVNAAIDEGYRFSGFGSVEQDRITEDPAREELTVDFRAVGGDVPAIAGEIVGVHGKLLPIMLSGGLGGGHPTPSVVLMRRGVDSGSTREVRVVRVLTIGRVQVFVNPQLGANCDLGLSCQASRNCLHRGGRSPAIRCVHPVTSPLQNSWFPHVSRNFRLSAALRPALHSPT